MNDLNLIISVAAFQRTFPSLLTSAISQVSPDSSNVVHSPLVLEVSSFL